MKTHRVAAIPGDGIGPEVVGAGLEVLQALEQHENSFRLEVSHFDWGSDYYHRTGLMMPSDGLDQLRDMDAIFFGAVGDPAVPDHITLRGRFDCRLSGTGWIGHNRDWIGFRRSGCVD
jgi:tartrate dehydrogenase/decarboxylase/D-malate dehydrogenase